MPIFSHREHEVVLDPMVEAIDAPDGFTLLRHPAWERGMSIPPLPGLRAFVKALRKPTRVRERIAQCADAAAATSVIERLVCGGFAYLPPRSCDDHGFRRLRRAWLARARRCGQPAAVEPESPARVHLPAGRAAERLAARGFEVVVDVAPTALASRAARARLVSWARAHHVQGLRLVAAGSLPLQAIAALDRAFADFDVVNWPSELDLAGLRPPRLFRGDDAARGAFVRRRLLRLLELERSCSNPQTDEAEAAWPGAAVAVVAQRLALRPGGLLLDLCGGRGRLARRLAPYVAPHGRVVVLDRDPVTLARGRHLVREPHLPIEFRRADATDVRLPDACADAILLTGALDYFERAGRTPQLFREIARLLRRGGRLVVQHPLEALPQTSSTERLSAELAAAGLRVVELSIRRYAVSRVARAPGSFAPALLPSLMAPRIAIQIPDAFNELLLSAERSGPGGSAGSPATRADVATG